MNSPKVLWPSFRLRGDTRFYFAGQMTGVEGYVESAASGLMAGIHAARAYCHARTLDFPVVTAMGALAHYISNPEVEKFQPMNVNYGLMPPLTKRVHKKMIRNALYAERAQAAFAPVRQLCNEDVRFED